MGRVPVLVQRFSKMLCVCWGLHRPPLVTVLHLGSNAPGSWARSSESSSMLLCCPGNWEPFLTGTHFKLLKLVHYEMRAIKAITQSLLQSFQNQLTETEAKNEQLLLENINLKKNLEIRWERISIILCKAISVDFALQAPAIVKVKCEICDQRNEIWQQQPHCSPCTVNSSC